MYQGKKVAVIIPAAGSGTRMGLPVPKQFMKIDGETMVAKTTRVFACNKFIDVVIILFPPKFMEKAEAKNPENPANAEWNGIVRDKASREKAQKEKLPEVHGIKQAIYGTQRAHIKAAILSGIGEVRDNLKFLVKQAGKKCIVITGDSSRSGSVRNGLMALPDDISIVLVHDAARPYVDDGMINDVIAAADMHGAAVPAVPLKDSLRTVDGGVDRDDYFLVQTPQGFRREVLVAAYNEAEKAGEKASDDASLVDRIGQRVFMVSGSYRNIKITTVEDLE